MSFCLFLSKIKINKKKIVQNTLWETTSSGFTNETYLKYKTPITPHQNEPENDDKIPLLKSFIIVINKHFKFFFYNFLVELN